MSNQFAAIAFTDAVREVQREMGSRAAYADFDSGVARNHRLGENEIAFLQMRDSFYMASVGETGWPYVQHRGGPPGFVRVLDDRTIGFADYRGNRQYVSVGNLRGNDRVSLFFMDYPNQARLKMLGRARVIGSDHEQMALLQEEHRASAEGLGGEPELEDDGNTSDCLAGLLVRHASPVVLAHFRGQFHGH